MTPLGGANKKKMKKNQITLCIYKKLIWMWSVRGVRAFPGKLVGGAWEAEVGRRALKDRSVKRSPRKGLLVGRNALPKKPLQVTGFSQRD